MREGCGRRHDLVRFVAAAESRTHGRQDASGVFDQGIGLWPIVDEAAFSLCLDKPPRLQRPESERCG